MVLVCHQRYQNPPRRIDIATIGNPHLMDSRPFFAMCSMHSPSSGPTRASTNACNEKTVVFACACDTLPPLGLLTGGLHGNGHS
jgi:hypothetical protein